MYDFTYKIDLIVKKTLFIYKHSKYNCMTKG
jgi:hypothetical protein